MKAIALQNAAVAAVRDLSGLGTDLIGLTVVPVVIGGVAPSARVGMLSTTTPAFFAFGSNHQHKDASCEYVSLAETE
jgi:hypothetical protein